MSLSFGGVAVLSTHSHVTEVAGIFLGKGHIKSIFCLLIFVIVVLLLAYLTNPSETSFRAYLTEQSFRLHLSHLDDHTDDKADDEADGSAKLDSPQLMNAGFCLRNAASFHFAKRASVSLRTPKHVFHNFGVFTVAAMMPVGRGSRRSPSSPSYHFCDRDTSSIIADSWYIGAFGRWWRGGIIEAWYRDLIARSNDEESWSSGILGMKSLDQFADECNGLPYASKASPSRDFVPKLRGRDKHCQSGVSHARSQTPPPLPHSVSLPLHASHQDLTPLLIPSAMTPLAMSAQPPPQHSEPAPSNSEPSQAISRAPSTGLFDQSPVIADVLRQISGAKTSLQDTRTQLNDHQNAASLSHSALKSEVDGLREKKREEDLARLDLKSRTKMLEDMKRSAEHTKRDAEKRLRAARTTQDDFTRRVASLTKEIVDLRRQCKDDEGHISQKQSTGASETDIHISDAIMDKKQEIKVAEDVVLALTRQARELEEKLVHEKERLKEMKARADIDKQALAFFSQQVPRRKDSWSLSHTPGPVPSPIPEHSVGSADLLTPSFTSSVLREPAYQPDGSMSRILDVVPSSNGSPISMGPANGYFVFNEDFPLLAGTHPTTSFSPFSDSDTGPTFNLPNSYDPQLPITPGLIPSSLMSSLDSAPLIPRSFPNEGDIVADKEWRNPRQDGLHKQTLGQLPHGLQPSMMSPLLANHGMGNEGEFGPIDGETLSHHHIPSTQCTYSDPPPFVSTLEPAWDATSTESMDTNKFGLPRRWFSKDKPKKGLNPDAKVFSFQKNTHPFSLPVSHPISASIGVHRSFDILNPNGLSSSALPSGAAATSLFSRAFAPSRAEREALQRALGSSSNNSLERLPSLSDVGSIPSSPNHVHATVANLNGHAAIGVGLHPSSELLHQSPQRSLPSWLQSLPRVRKPNFSPWDDDEATPTSEIENSLR